MKVARLFFNIGYVFTSILFMIASLVLLVFAVLELWHGLNPQEALELEDRLRALIEAIGLLTIAVATLELSQIILEEEVIRQAEVSGPTRVRRFLSRFMIVLVVAMAIECLVAVFLFLHTDPSYLPQASMIGFVAAALLAAWGVFIRLNRSAEELEPEAMQETKREDAELRD